MSEHEHECGPADPFAVRFPGPFTYHDVVVRGWTVPLLRAHMRGEDQIRVVLDDRLGLDLSSAEAERVLPFIANAIAVALGYGAHPRENMESLPGRTPQAAPRRVFDVLPST
jgi:hypothetical protein